MTMPPPKNSPLSSLALPRWLRRQEEKIQKSPSCLLLCHVPDHAGRFFQIREKALFSGFMAPLPFWQHGPLEYFKSKPFLRGYSVDFRAFLSGFPPASGDSFSMDIKQKLPTRTGGITTDCSYPYLDYILFH